jgi:hypothetical protein
VLAHQQARSEDAVALIERSLELEPERADWYSNLGIVLQDRLRLDKVIAAYGGARTDPITPTPTTTPAWCSDEREGRRGGGRVSSCHPHRPPRGRVQQPRRPAERS